MELTNCSSLTEIDFFGNHFTGSIPQTIGNLKNLVFLLLRQNDLSGPVPPSLGYCNKIQKLVLADNKLSGTLPATFRFLSDVSIITLYNVHKPNFNLQFRWSRLGTYMSLLPHKVSGSKSPLDQSMQSFAPTIKQHRVPSNKITYPKQHRVPSFSLLLASP